jgi:hypothetical protein
MITISLLYKVVIEFDSVLYRFEKETNAFCYQTIEILWQKILQTNILPTNVQHKVVRHPTTARQHKMVIVSSLLVIALLYSSLHGDREKVNQKFRYTLLLLRMI